MCCWLLVITTTTTFVRFVGNVTTAYNFLQLLKHYNQYGCFNSFHFHGFIMFTTSFNLELQISVSIWINRPIFHIFLEKIKLLSMKYKIKLFYKKKKVHTKK